MMENSYAGRVGLQQRVLPVYRAPFFDHLAQHCLGGLGVLAGEPRAQEGIVTADRLRLASYSRARNVHVLSGNYYLCWQQGIEDWIEAWNPDLLIVEANPRYLSTGKAVGWMHARGRPVIGWGLGAPPLEGRFSSIRRARRSRFVRLFDALIAYSEQGAEEYRKLGFPVDSIFIAHNAVSPSPSSTTPRRPFEGQAKILFVGRLQERKRVDMLIRACAGSGYSPELTVVGDGPAMNDLEALAKEIYPNTRFVGAQHGPSAAPYFREADLFVLPGTGGLAVQEAMSYALPVIVAEGDGTQNDLVSGNGWLIPPADQNALTEALRHALSDRMRLVEFGKRSYELAVERFNIEAMANAFIRAMCAVSGAED
jgi:glycosyltransferase involved in cell wall biosynthesis